MENKNKIINIKIQEKKVDENNTTENKQDHIETKEVKQIKEIKDISNLSKESKTLANNNLN